MSESPTKKQILLGLVLLGTIITFVLWGLVTLWTWFSSLNSDLAVGLLTASSTIIVATITLVLGRYFERVKEAETHLRTQKIQMYDEFLKEFFKLFHGKNTDNETALVPFLQEWQRKLVVWGGPGVLSSFIKWKNHLGGNEPDATSVYLMDEFFRSMRSDIGLSNRGLEKGFFSHLILRHSQLFLSMAKANPKVTLRELSEKEKSLGLDDR